jgi:hypothetical protein
MLWKTFLLIFAATLLVLAMPSKGQTWYAYHYGYGGGYGGSAHYGYHYGGYHYGGYAGGYHYGYARRW